ncbi:hypothetical protein EVAR_16218_1 [Eumeta japonica]|uniref:Uncharacterized protein n=1 Tax=Eumeta variegata TaxID=151549 RepID=A0A4C1U5U4_EUMVA|nr:hypothetical protein EVAR_16218_1 [Eumeta japonica]
MVNQLKTRPEGDAVDVLHFCHITANACALTTPYFRLRSWGWNTPRWPNTCRGLPTNTVTNAATAAINELCVPGAFQFICDLEGVERQNREKQAVHTASNRTYTIYVDVAPHSIRRRRSVRGRRLSVRKLLGAASPASDAPLSAAVKVTKFALFAFQNARARYGLQSYCGVASSIKKLDRIEPTKRRSRVSPNLDFLKVWVDLDW